MSSDNMHDLFLFVIVAIVFIIGKTLLNAMQRRQRAKKYVQLFSENYGNRDVRTTLEIIRDSFKKGTPEYKCLDKAVKYLYLSCLKDYQTAFAFIEDVLTTKDVEDLHDKVLEKEKNNMLLLLEKGAR